jgi:hypothetical protein
MTKKKVSIHAILKRAGIIAETTGESREDIVAKLKKNHEALGIEVDLGAQPANGTVLDFTAGKDPDFARTQVLPRSGVGIAD